MEGDRGAAPVGSGAGRLQLRHRKAAREVLGPGLAVAGDLDEQIVGQRVDDRDADAVQTARRGVDLAVELAAGMQRGEDDFERRLVLEFGVRIDRDAAAVVAHQDLVARQHLQPDRVGVAGDGLVHRIVQHLGHEMMHGPFVGAADIHAGALADGFEPFQHLDVMGRVGVFLRSRRHACRRQTDRTDRRSRAMPASCLSAAARGDRLVAGWAWVW